MVKINWICCLQQNNSFVGYQQDIFESTEPLYYDDYYETHIGIEVCSKCKAKYSSYTVSEFSIPRIYFHIPISEDTYNKFSLQEKITKEELFNSNEYHLVLVEREIQGKSIWEWENITEDMLIDI